MGNLKRKRESHEESLTLDCEWVRGEMIGRGEFGSVYEASFKKPKLISHDFPKIIAVKSAPFSRVLELVNENSLLQLFGNCRNVIAYLGDDVTVGADGNLVYNVFMEFADRGTLWDLISDYGGLGLTEPQMSIYTEAILRGLEFIHDMGYVHCDIKPQNILLVTKGWRTVPKLGDFGLARLDSPEHHQECRGTPLYMSPEMVIDGIQERPSDVWGLWCVVFNMLTGRGHWDIKVDAGFEDIAPIIAHESPVIPAGLSEEAKDFLAKCFVRNPDERFTAAMLLCHPFVTKHSIVEEQEDEPLEQTSSDSYLDDCDSSCISHQSWSSDEKAEDSRPPKASKMAPLALTFPGALRHRIQCQQASDFPLSGLLSSDFARLRSSLALMLH